MRILAINPGSTSTKFAVFEDEKPLYHATIRHSISDLAHFHSVADQYEYRKQLILDALAKEGIPLDFRAVVGRGGLLKPMPGGVFEVNEQMRRDIMAAKRQHACNLGGLIAAELAEGISGCHAYIADAGVTDELDDIARVTGNPLFPKITIFHALNQKAVARRHAASVGRRYEDMNLVVAHLGGGISVGAHRHGRVVDVNNALDGSGPFSPERTGTVQAGELINACYSGRYTKEEMVRMIFGKGGLMSHFGTNDAKQLSERAKHEPHVALVIDAMLYNVSKEIGALCAALCGKVDAILLTGGIAYDKEWMEKIKERVQFLAPVHVYPGEDELEALALSGLRALRGEEEVQQYT